MELPDLTGQPPWVVILVSLLVVLGGLGAAWIKRRSDAEDPEDTPQVPPAPSTMALPAGSYDPIREAMGHMVNQAAKNAEDADRAEGEAKDLAKQLATCGRELAVLQERFNVLAAQLAACQERDRYRQQGTNHDQ